MNSAETNTSPDLHLVRGIHLLTIFVQIHQEDPLFQHRHQILPESFPQMFHLVQAMVYESPRLKFFF